MQSFPGKLILPGLLTHILIIVTIGLSKKLETKQDQEIIRVNQEYGDIILRLHSLKENFLEFTLNEIYLLKFKNNKEVSKNKRLLFTLENKFYDLKISTNKIMADEKILSRLENPLKEKLQQSEELFYQSDTSSEKFTIKFKNAVTSSRAVSVIFDQIQTELNSSKKNRLNEITEKKLIFERLFLIFFIAGIALLFVVFVILKHYINYNKKVIGELHDNTSLLQGIIDNSPAPISVKGLDGKYTFSNKKFTEITEKKLVSVAGHTDDEIFNTENVKIKREKDLEVLKSASVIKFEESLNLNGETTSFITTKFPILNAKGNIYSIGSISTDISEKSKADLELFRKEKMMNMYFENCPGSLIVIDQESKIVAANQKTIKTFGWTLNEMIGQYMPGLMMNQDNWDKHQSGMKKFAETGKGPVLDGTLELLAFDKSKEERKIELTVKDFKIEDRQYFIGLIQDITEKKKKTTELEENLIFLNSIIENLPNMIFIKDAQTLKFLRINKAAEKLLGISRNEIIGKNDYDFFPKKEADFFTKNDREVIDKKLTLDIPEEEISTRLGTRWLHTQKIALSNKNQTPHYLLGISEDITEKKILGKERDNALNQLKESELRLELVLSNIGEGVVLTDEHQHVLLFNQMASEIFNTDNQQTLSRWTSEFQFFHPETKAIYPAQMLPLERALRGQSTDDVEIILQEIKTEQIKLIKVNGRPIQNNEGKIVAAVATIKDITHLKEIEKKLEESEMKYRQTIGFKQEKKD